MNNIINPIITRFGVEGEVDTKLINIGNIQRVVGNDDHIVIRTVLGDYSPIFTRVDLRDDFMERLDALPH